MKLVVLAARHGPGMDFGNYINCYFNGAKAQISEGKTKKQVLYERKSSNGDS